MYFSKLLQVFLPHFLLALAGQEHQLDEEQDAELVNIITMMKTGLRCLDAAINNAYMLRSLLFTFLLSQKSCSPFLLFLSPQKFIFLVEGQVDVYFQLP